MKSMEDGGRGVGRVKGKIIWWEVEGRRRTGRSRMSIAFEGG